MREIYLKSNAPRGTAVVGASQPFALTHSVVEFASALDAKLKSNLCEQKKCARATPQVGFSFEFLNFACKRSNYRQSNAPPDRCRLARNQRFGAALGVVILKEPR
jgi:hypothetical protein